MKIKIFRTEDKKIKIDIPSMIVSPIIFNGIVGRIRFGLYYLKDRPTIESYSIDLMSEFNIGE